MATAIRPLDVPESIYTAVDAPFEAALLPDPDRDVSEWADEYRVLSRVSAGEPGRWRTSRTPFLREIMNCLSPSSPFSRVVFVKPAQIGGSEVLLNFLGYIIHYAPGPTMMVQPTVELAKRFSRQRIATLIETTRVLARLVSDPRERDSGNTILAKEFPGGVLVATGANSAVGLRSMPARYLLMDEVDAYPTSASSGGSDPARFNDPWDCKPYFDPALLDDPQARDATAEALISTRTGGAALNHIDERLRVSPDFLKAAIQQFSTHMLDFIASRWGVYCLTPDPCLTLMWSHYEGLPDDARNVRRRGGTGPMLLRAPVSGRLA
jgi:hypothetical protein